jgi:hypothetical protein
MAVLSADARCISPAGPSGEEGQMNQTVLVSPLHHTSVAHMPLSQSKKSDGATLQFSSES